MCTAHAKREGERFCDGGLSLWCGNVRSGFFFASKDAGRISWLVHSAEVKVLSEREREREKNCNDLANGATACMRMLKEEMHAGTRTCFLHRDYSTAENNHF